MGHFRLSAGTRFRWRDRLWEIEGALSASQIVVTDLLSGLHREVERRELLEAAFDGNLVFASDTMQSKPNSGSDEYPVDLADYPAHLVETARFRQSVLERVIGLPRTERKKRILELVNEIRYAQETISGPVYAISKSSVYEWLDVYERSNGDIRSLIPDVASRGGAGVSRLPSEVDAILATVVEEKYMNVRERTGIDALMREINLRIGEVNAFRPKQDALQTLSRSTVVRRLKAMGAEERFRAKHSAQETSRRFKQYGHIEYPTRILECIEIDHTPLDIIVSDEDDGAPIGRMTLTIAIDRATRYPLGFYIGAEPPGYIPVLECLYSAILPKAKRYRTTHAWYACGIPERLVTDRGREFGALEDAADMLGFVIDKAPPRTPQYKASVERMFRTINTLVHTLPGTTFSNIRHRGDYESMKRACLNLEEIEQIIAMFLVDQYAESYHEGLQAVPAREWERQQSDFSPRLPGSSRDLMIALGRTATRVLQHYGIDFENLRYQSEDLRALRGERTSVQVKIKFHPGDLGSIYVLDTHHKLYVEVPALQHEYATGLSLWAHRVVTNYANANRDRPNNDEIAQSRREVEALVETAKARVGKTGSRRKVRRFEDSGNTPSLNDNKQASPVLLPDASTARPRLNAPMNQTDEQDAFTLDVNPESLGWTVDRPSDT